MGNITLLELNVPEGDIQLGPKSLRSSKSPSESSQAATTDTADTTDDSGRSLVPLLVAVGVIALVVVMASKLLGEDADDEIAGFDESD